MGGPVFVVGASRGIGLELAGLLCGEGVPVHAIGRSEAPERQIPGMVYRRVAAEQFTLEAFPEAGTVRYATLVLNSAVAGPPAKRGLELAPERLREVLDTNVVAHYRVLHHLRARMMDDGSATAVFVISLGGIQARIKGEVAISYRTSKAAQIALALALVEPCRAAGIAVFLVNPGSAATAIGGRQARFTAVESAAKVRAILAGARSHPSGTLFDHDGRVMTL